jgi:protein-S-isoprenylcysteine O-methyltransferase Ste14
VAQELLARLAPRLKTGRAIVTGRRGIKACAEPLLERAETAMRLLPPILVLILLATMIMLRIFAPGPVVASYHYPLAGAVLAILGLLVTWCGAHHFTSAGTNIKTFNEPGVLVTDGLFQWSRNPMYAGFLLLLAGIAILLGAATPFLPVIVFAVIADRWYIAFEERALARKFGEEYEAYKRRARRWI